VQEIVRIKKWSKEGLSCEPNAKSIFLSYDLGPNSIPISNISHPPSMLYSTSWQGPPLGFLKINFDGASKGNQGPAGFDFIFQDEYGNIHNTLVESSIMILIAWQSSGPFSKVFMPLLSWVFIISLWKVICESLFICSLRS
jgi:hypothetical protein